MKKPLILGFLLSFVLFACSKEAEKPKSLSTVTEKKTEAVKSFARIENDASKRMAFDLLTTDEKVELAGLHLDFCITYFDLTQVQKTVLQNIKTKLHLLYTGDPEENEHIMILDLDVNEYFSNLDYVIAQIIFDSMITDEEGVAAFIAGGTDAISAGVECQCNQRSNWCTVSPFSPKIPCDPNCRNQTTRGCGNFWVSACNGRCNIFLM